MNSAGLQVQLQQQKPIPLAVQFDCQAGETLALVGPSGSGKTTILRCIAGLAQAQSGAISVHNICWQDSKRGIFLSAQQRRVGMVFQSYALFPHLSASENIATALSHLPSGQRADRAQQLLQSVHLDGLAQRYPHQLSGGQQQRVALARALAREPAVLLLDEPFSAVDQVTRRKLRMELAMLTRSLHIPIILVTHDLDEAAMLAQRLCVIHAGRSLQTGCPDEVFKQPQDSTVARLMDAVNVFDAEVLEQHPDSDQLQLVWQGQTLQASSQQRYQAGEKVLWLIPPGNVLLHRRRPWRQPFANSSQDHEQTPYRVVGERENPVFGDIVEMLTLSGMTTVVMRVKQQSQLRLTLQLPPHVVSRNALALGESIGVSLPAQAIHVMRD